MAGDQKWEMAESTIGIIFLFEIQIHYFLYIQGIFKSHLKKIIPLKIPIWPKFLLYKPEKWLTRPPPPPAPPPPVEVEMLSYANIYKGILK